MRYMLFDKKYLLLTWTEKPRPDKRKFRYRRNARVKNIYLQLLRFEMVLWYK